MSQLRKRLVSSAFLVSIAISTIFLAPLWLFVIITEILILLSLNEFFALTERKHPGVNRVLGLCFGAMIPVAALYGTDGLVLVVCCLFLFVYNFRPGRQDQALSSTAITMLGMVYIAWFFSHLIDLRRLDYGAQWVFYTALVVKGGDAGAYFVGKNMGRVKLLEHVSPNKSVEGAVGGLLTTVFLSLLSALYIPTASIAHLLLLGALVGVVSQLGDLGESLLKREAGIKDSGQIPGLGGIFDVLDSLLLTVPFVYYYVNAFI